MKGIEDREGTEKRTEGVKKKKIEEKYIRTRGDRK
jgi:hypothetical protein